MTAPDQTAAGKTPADPVLTRLERVELDGEGLSGLTPLFDADRKQAVADLTAGSHFEPLTRTGTPGPYVLYLSIRSGRLLFDVRDRHEAPLTAIGLALGPFHGLVKDYQLLVDSHIKAVQEGREARIQAIDMGRRGLHNEGAELMRQRLAGKIEIDFDTARRLFTLVCVLHHRVSAR
ncbi:MAG: UPF0262 family protein [Acetobacteraceae bacterium]|nr:UPF0262 family protein [Acetobacteraceae bacterium]